MSQAVLVTGRTWHRPARGADGGGVRVQQSEGPTNGSEQCGYLWSVVTGPQHRLPGEDPRALLTNGADSGQQPAPAKHTGRYSMGGRHSEMSAQLLLHLGASSLPPHWRPQEKK